MPDAGHPPAHSPTPPRMPWLWAVFALALVLLGAWWVGMLVKPATSPDVPDQVISADGQEVPGWGRVKHPDDQCKVEVDGDRVRFVLPANTPSPVSSSSVSYHPPRVEREVAGDFRVRVRVGALDFQEDRSEPPNASPRPHVNAVLFVQAESMNFVDLERCSWDWDTEAGGKLDSVCRGDAWARARPVVAGKFDPAAPGHLELVRCGDVVTARVSPDGQTWTDPIPHKLTLPATVRVGVTAYGVGTGPPFSVEFDGFEVVPLPPEGGR